MEERLGAHDGPMECGVLADISWGSKIIASSNLTSLKQSLQFYEKLNKKKSQNNVTSTLRMLGQLVIYH